MHKLCYWSKLTSLLCCAPGTHMRYEDLFVQLRIKEVKKIRISLKT